MKIMDPLITMNVIANNNIMKIFKLGLLLTLLYSCATNSQKNSTFEFKQDLGKVFYTLDVPENYSDYNDSLGQNWYMCGLGYCFVNSKDSSYIEINNSLFDTTRGEFIPFNTDNYKIWTVNSLSDTLLSYQEYKMKDYSVSEYFFSYRRNKRNYYSLKSFITFNDLLISIRSTYPNIKNETYAVDKHKKIVNSLKIKIIDKNNLYKGVAN